MRISKTAKSEDLQSAGEHTDTLQLAMILDVESSMGRLLIRFGSQLSLFAYAAIAEFQLTDRENVSQSAVQSLRFDHRA